MQVQKIETKIHEIKGHRVMLDFDLAGMYGVETRALKQAVKRNPDRFPNDFMFQLTKTEWQEVITNCDNLPENVKYSPAMPFAFTEQGVAMLSSVLKSKKAIQVNIGIMRAFVLLRQYALSHRELTEKLKELENRYNKQFSDIYEVIGFLLIQNQQTAKQRERQKIGFKQKR